MNEWFTAAQQGDVNYISQHMDKFAGVRDQLFNNKTALMYAAQYD